jgi:O-antigen/teichoic acid export membrane protein
MTIFEITEAELEELERGTQESLYLNLGIAAISIAASFLIALLTTVIDDTKTFCVFVIVCAVGFVASLTFGLLWWQARKKLKHVSRAIRNRMLPEGIQDNPGEEKPEQAG